MKQFFKELHTNESATRSIIKIIYLYKIKWCLRKYSSKANLITRNKIIWLRLIIYRLRTKNYRIQRKN